jgi:sterol desaturase/sphingolipid hydroxylase (fatty acid hydroxylase superfamily)
MLSGMLRRALSWLSYPALTGGAVVFCLWALGRGWPAWAIGVVVVVASSVVVEVLERVIPYSAAWARPQGDRTTDVWHMIISNRAFDLGTFVAISVFVPAGAWLSGTIGFSLWPHGWSLGAQSVLALVLVELPWYWIHRLEHTTHALWRLHAVHHSAGRIYWWNVARNHPLDNLISAASSMALLSLLGVGEGPLAVIASFSGAHALLQHANIDLRTGLLDWVFTTARVHRWHHSKVLSDSHANYGPTLTLWDHVFRTRQFSPEAVPPEAVGLSPDNEGFPQGFVGQMTSPFDARLWGAPGAAARGAETSEQP